MIDKEVVTTKTEVWSDKKSTHRYVFRRQWSTGTKEEKTGPLAVVITIRPTSTEAFVKDLSLLLIEKNCRQLGFAGFIAVNLFSLVQRSPRISYQKANDSYSLETIQTALSEKRVEQIIFACGSVTKTNQLASQEMKKLYNCLTEKQKRQTKVLVDPDGNAAHPLNVRVREKWALIDYSDGMNEKEVGEDVKTRGSYRSIK